MHTKRDIIYVKIGTEALLDSEKIENSDISSGVTRNKLFNYTRHETLRKNVAIPTLDFISQGYQVIFRVSGSIGLGKLMDGIKTKTTDLSKEEKVTLAAQGQSSLIEVYSRIFDGLIKVGGITATEEDRKRGTFIQTTNAMHNQEKLMFLNENDPLDYSELDGNNDIPTGYDVQVLATHHNVMYTIFVGTEKGLYQNYGKTNAKIIKDIFYDRENDLGINILSSDFKFPLKFKGQTTPLEELIVDTSGNNSNGGKELRLKGITQVNRSGVDAVEGHYNNKLDDIISGVGCERTYYHADMPKHL